MLERQTERYGMMSVLLGIPWACFELLEKKSLDTQATSLAQS